MDKFTAISKIIFLKKNKENNYRRVLFNIKLIFLIIFLFLSIFVNRTLASDYCNSRWIYETPPVPSGTLPDEYNVSIFRDILECFFANNIPDSYRMRTDIMYRDPYIFTYMGYARIKPDIGSDLKIQLSDPDYWLDRRKDVHRKIQNRHFASAIRVSKLLGEVGSPVLYLMRGNSGSGKSYFLKNFSGMIDERLPEAMAKESLGILNPDLIKSELQWDFGEGLLTSEQVHEEGSHLSSKIQKKYFDESLSMIIDKRFGDFVKTYRVIEDAKKRGYRVIMVDLDVSLEKSLERISKRIKDGGYGSTMVPLSRIISGFSEARAQRQMFVENTCIDEYYLYSSSGEEIKTILIRKGEDIIFSDKTSLLDVYNSKLDESFLEKMSDKYKIILKRALYTRGKDLDSKF